MTKETLSLTFRDIKGSDFFQGLTFRDIQASGVWIFEVWHLLQRPKQSRISSSGWDVQVLQNKPLISDLRAILETFWSTNSFDS